jgi:fumarate hydratase subunit beta
MKRGVLLVKYDNEGIDKKDCINIISPTNSDITNKLKVGDIVNISGKIITARDQAHKRIIEEGTPVDLKGVTIFHSGPIVKENNINNNNINNKSNNNSNNGNNNASRFEIIAIGPTTSMRMNPYESEVIDMGVKIIIGKGGMDESVAKALKKNKAVYLAAVGGCAALYVNAVKKIDNVHWLDLGIPEALWELSVENFGPLIVAMDSHGNNLYK